MSVTLSRHRAGRAPLIAPHGGVLVDLLVDRRRADELRAESRHWTSWTLTPRQLCDLELLLTGGFSPLAGFMTRADHESVCETMHLDDGTLWPIPVTLDVPEAFVTTVGAGSSVALRDGEGVMLAALHVEDVWMPNRSAEALAVYGTADPRHPGVAALDDRHARWAVGGRVEGLGLPSHFDFQRLRLSPSALRETLARRGDERVVAFQARDVLHRAERDLTARIAAELGAHLLLHPVADPAMGAVDHFARVRCCQRVLRRYPPETVTLALLPSFLRRSGPREALWQAIVAKNHGCSHVIVERAPQLDALPPFADDELGVGLVPRPAMGYLPDEDRYAPDAEIPPGSRTLRLSDAELRDSLAAGRPLPEWFTFGDVAEELQRSHPPRSRQGITIFFTGLSGAGKSTIANVLLTKLLELGGRPATLLDGDVVRGHLSSELGFSKEHRDLNVRRIGFVASEITKNRGIAICAPIAPYDAVRKEVRRMIELVGGGFILVHVATPLEVCEQRDRKGLYAKARAGLIQHFTGISDPYEVPEDADLVIESTPRTPQAAAADILRYLIDSGYCIVDEPDRAQTESPR